LILPDMVSESTYLKQHVARFRSNMTELAPVMDRGTAKAARERGIIPLRSRHNLLYALSVIPPRTQPVCQVSDSQQVIGRERAAARCDDHEWIRRYGIGPRCWQAEQLPVPIAQMDPVLTPAVTVLDELEDPA
jgi:hypothetical protein